MTPRSIRRRLLWVIRIEDRILIGLYGLILAIGVVFGGMAW